MYKLLSRANPHLTLRARQATAHVTPRRSAHPRFTSTSPILTHPHRPPLCGLHRLTSAHPSRLRCAHPRSPGCRERQLLARRIQGGQNGLLVPKWVPGTKMGSQTHHPGVVYQCYCRGGVGILPCNALLILLSAVILALKFSSLARSPAVHPDYSSLPLTLCFSLLEFRSTKPVMRRTSHLRSTANPPFFIWKVLESFARSREKPPSQDGQEKDSSREGEGGTRERV